MTGLEPRIYGVRSGRRHNPKFLYTKLRGPSHGIFVRCIALKAESKTLMFTFIICQNTHSTNTTCDLNSVTKL